MRVIFNIHSHKAAVIAGWRAKAIQINNESKEDLSQVLKSVCLSDGTSMYKYIVDKDHLGKNWILFVNGRPVCHNASLKMEVRDNVQIHLMDKTR